MLTREEQATNAGRSGHAFAGASCPARDRAVSTTGAGPVCNSNRVPDGDCHDGLWGQVAVWPPALSGWPGEPAPPVHCPPWWPRAPTTCYGTRRRRGQSLGGVLQRLAGLPAGAVPAHARTGQGLVHSSSRRPETGSPAVNGRRGSSFGDLPTDKLARCAWVIAAGPRRVAEQLKQTSRGPGACELDRCGQSISYDKTILVGNGHTWRPRRGLGAIAPRRLWGVAR
jgi:hypothetical protein